MNAEDFLVGDWGTHPDGQIVYTLRFNADNTGTLQVWELNRVTFDLFKWVYSLERNELTLITDGPPESDFFADKPFTVILRKDTTPDGKTHEVLGLGIWMDETKIVDGDQCVEFPAGLGVVEFRRKI